MAGVRKSHLEELARIQERVRALFEELLLRPGIADGTAEGVGSPLGAWSPAVDVLETDDAFLLYAEVPGTDREDVELAVEGRRLKLSGRRRALPPDRAFARMERSDGPFRRSFDLPGAVDADRISASLERGVLRVTLPKRADDAAGAGSGTVPIENEGGA